MFLLINCSRDFSAISLKNGTLMLPITQRPDIHLLLCGNSCHMGGSGIEEGSHRIDQEILGCLRVSSVKRFRKGCNKQSIIKYSNAELGSIVVEIGGDEAMMAWIEPANNPDVHPEKVFPTEKEERDKWLQI